MYTSPRFKIGSLTVTEVEFTKVEVPSTCKSPLITTVPSLLNPSGYGSMYRVFPEPGVVLITFELIPILSIVTPPVLVKVPV